MKGYRYQKGIADSPENFPDGCAPRHVKSFEEAMTEARKMTSEGILVISDKKDCVEYTTILDRMNEPWKRYSTKNDFSETQNPFHYLLEGKILFTDHEQTFGFEWTSVIYFQQFVEETIEIHECNSVMRCTTNLIIVEQSQF